MSRRIIVAVAAAVLTSTVPLGQAAQAGGKWASCPQHSSIERNLAQMVQTARATVGNASLNLDQDLSRVAARHSYEMDNHDTLYKTPVRKLRYRVTGEVIVGENVGVGANIADIHRALLNSETYKENIADPRLRHLGVAVRQDDDRYWVTTVFEAKTNPGTVLGCQKNATVPDPDPTPTPDPTPSTDPTPDPTPTPDPDPTPTPDPDPTPDVGTLSVTAPNSYSARISWVLPAGTVRARILREGRLIDEVVVTGVLEYTDHLLWKSTSYDYEVKAIGPGGGVIDAQTDGVTTKDQIGSFPRLYSDNSFWNTPIESSPAIDPNSSGMVQKALVGYRSSAHLSNSDTWGISLAYASPLSKLYNVGCTRYGCDRAVSARIPRYAAANGGSDGKLTVIEPTTNTEFDAWIAEYNAIDDTWRAGSRFSTRSDGWGALCGLGEHCNGPNAMGTAGMGGVVRPEEIAQGHIDHALAVATPYTRSGYIACPGTHTDGKYSDPDAIPQGARIQMDPSFNVDAMSWPRWKKVVAKALQKYGAYIDDTGGSLSISSESNVNRGYDAWTFAGVTGSKSLADFPWEKFRVLKLEQC